MAQQVGMRDRYDLPLSTGSSVAAEAYIDGLDRVLSGNIGAEDALDRAIQSDEGFAMAYVTRASFDVRQRQFAEGVENAQKARDLAAGTSRREQQHIGVITEMILGNGMKALDLALEHLDEFPADANILQNYTYLMFAKGDYERNAKVLDLIEKLEPAYGDEWFYTGTRSFYLHELDRFDEARRYAEKSLEGNPRNGNATHNLAHCFYETADYTGGLDFLNHWIVGYQPEAPFFSHLSWHMALFELTQGRYERTHDIYRQSLRPIVFKRWGGLGPPLADSTSLLWRFDLYGMPVPEEEWAEVADFAIESVTGPSFAFQDAHATLALAATGNIDIINQVVDRLRRRAERGNDLDGDITLPLVLGIEAFGRGAYDEAIRHIEPMADEMVRIGGSQAQRQVFEETLLQAYMHAAQYEKAEQMLRKRLEHRHTARDFYWLADVQSGQGNEDAAAESRARARSFWIHPDPTAPELPAD